MSNRKWWKSLFHQQHEDKKIFLFSTSAFRPVINDKTFAISRKLYLIIISPLILSAPPYLFFLYASIITPPSPSPSNISFHVLSLLFLVTVAVLLLALINFMFLHDDDYIVIAYLLMMLQTISVIRKRWQAHIYKL